MTNSEGTEKRMGRLLRLPLSFLHDDAPVFVGVAGEVHPAAARARFAATGKFLDQRTLADRNQLAALGCCFGGGIVLDTSRSGEPPDGTVSDPGLKHTSTKPVADNDGGRFGLPRKSGAHTDHRSCTHAPDFAKPVFG